MREAASAVSDTPFVLYRLLQALSRGPRDGPGARGPPWCRAAGEGCWNGNSRGMEGAASWRRDQAHGKLGGTPRVEIRSAGWAISNGRSWSREQPADETSLDGRR